MGEESEVLQEVVEHFDVIFMNRLGFERTFGIPPNPEIIQKIQSKNGQIINVTIGSKGSYLCSSDGFYHIPIWEVDVVDTTGAGDAYAAGFLNFYLQRLPLIEVGQKAAACAALQITRTSARDGLPRTNELEAFLQKRLMKNF